MGWSSGGAVCGLRGVATWTLSASRVSEQLAYWKSSLSGAPSRLEFRPTTLALSSSSTGATAWGSINAALSGALKELSRRQGVTLYVTLLAAWSLVLGRLSGARQVVIGSPVAGRNRGELEPLVGCSSHPGAVDGLSGEPTVSSLLQRTRARVLQAQEHQDVPFEQVVEALEPTRSLSHTPVFQVSFAWQNTPGGELSLPGLQVTLVDSPLRTSQFDMTLSLQERGGEIVGSLNYATSLWERVTVERFAEYFRRAVAEMVRDEVAAGVAAVSAQ